MNHASFKYALNIAWNGTRLVGYLCIVITVLSFISVSVHEVFHMLTGNLLGYTGFIMYDMNLTKLSGVYTTYCDVSSSHKLLIGLSGGMGTSLIFLALYLLILKFNNPYLKLVVFITMSYNFIYALFESQIIKIDIGSFAYVSLYIAIIVSLLLHYRKIRSIFTIG